MNDADYSTYQDLAQRVKVDPKTIARLVCRLERLRLIQPYRPSKTIVRLSPKDVLTVLQHHHA